MHRLNCLSHVSMSWDGETRPGTTRNTRRASARTAAAAPNTLRFFFLGGEIPLNSLPRRKLRIRGGKSDYKGAVLDVTLSSLAVLFSVDSGRRKRKTHSLFNSCSLRSWLGQWRDWRQLVWGRGKLAKGKVMEWRSLPPDQICLGDCLHFFVMMPGLFLTCRK